MVTINLELWQNPNFPPLDILESRTKIVLENFNRCRKLNINLRIRNDKIEEFYPLFNSLTERRAVESLRLSLYAEDVDIYMKLLSEESTSIGVVLETLSSLLDTAQERHEVTKMLKEEYQKFFEIFNIEFSNVKIILTSDSRQIITRTEFDEPLYYSSINRRIKFVNFSISLFFACFTFRLIHNFPKSLTENGLNLMMYTYLYLSYKGKEYILPKYQDSQEKLQGSDRVLENNNNNNFINDSSKKNESHPSENFVGILKSFVKNLFNKGQEYFYQTVQNTGITNEDINFGLPIDDYSTDIDKHDSTAELDSATKTNELDPTAEPDSATTDLGKIDPAIANAVMSSGPIKSLQVGEISSASSADIIIAGVVGVCIGYLIYKFLRRTKSTQRQWWIKYFMKAPELEEQQQIIEKDRKILEIREILPVIIQNVEILDQFWGNQVINIKSHIETLSSADENEKIRIPKQMAVPIKEKWNNQHNDSKANYARMKDYVTRSSLLSID